MVRSLLLFVFAWTHELKMQQVPVDIFRKRSSEEETAVVHIILTHIDISGFCKPSELRKCTCDKNRRPAWIFLKSHRLVMTFLRALPGFVNFWWFSIDQMNNNDNREERKKMSLVRIHILPVPCPDMSFEHLEYLKLRQLSTLTLSKLKKSLPLSLRSVYYLN